MRDIECARQVCRCRMFEPRELGHQRAGLHGDDDAMLLEYHLGLGFDQRTKPLHSATKKDGIVERNSQVESPSETFVEPRRSVAINAFQSDNPVAFPYHPESEIVHAFDIKQVRRDGCQCRTETIAPHIEELTLFDPD